MRIRRYVHFVLRRAGRSISNHNLTRVIFKELGVREESASDKTRAVRNRDFQNRSPAFSRIRDRDW